MALTRWEPFETLTPLREAMNRLLEESFVGPARLDIYTSGRAFPVDIRETENEYIVEASLPGMKPEEMQITAVGNTLTIRATRKREEKKEEAGMYVRREHYEGEVSRVIELPSLISPERVEATYEQGMLILHLPKAEEAKPKTISVKVH